MNRNSKTILNPLRKFRITCSYDEVEIFKKYADANAAKGGYHNGGPKPIYCLKLSQIILAMR